LSYIQLTMQRANEPGSAKYGNFINYYVFNPPEQRLQIIPTNLLKDYCTCIQKEGRILALDIGCNSGELTLDLYDHLLSSKDHDKEETEPDSQNLKILGVDMDPVLIERAAENNRHRESVSFDECDIMLEAARRSAIDQYFQQYSTARFDMVFAFSITMWIHLNHGDDGLKEFLRYICSIATYLVIEPQPWKCYVSAERRMKKLICEPFEHFKCLQWKSNVENDIVDYLKNSCSMNLVDKFGETKWNRSVFLFVRQDSTSA